MLNMALAIALAAVGLCLAWWNHRRLQRIRGRLDFSQTVSRTLVTFGAATMGLFLGYVVAFPPSGEPLLGEGHYTLNDVTHGRMGREMNPQSGRTHKKAE